jgi:CHAD domain-containing protein
VTQGRNIGDNTPAAALIDLHKACKEFQYLLEFFRPLCQEKSFNRVKRRLDRLEDNLENFEDLELQQQRLRRYIAEMRVEQRLVQQAALEAMDLLIRDMAERETKVRKGFAKRFAKFSDEECQNLMQALFSAPAGPQPETP